MVKDRYDPPRKLISPEYLTLGRARWRERVVAGNGILDRNISGAKVP